MPLTTEQKNKIDKLISSKMDKKLKNYGRDTQSMPFLSRIVQDNEKMAAYSFIHSMSTTLGMSIYKEISLIIAEPHSELCFRNYNLGGVISSDQKKAIREIIKELRGKTRKPNIETDIQSVLNAGTKDSAVQKSGNTADFYMIKKGKEFYFEIKTTKANIDVFEKSKTKLLEWVARKGKRIYPYLVFPYNPYHPNSYNRFNESNLVKINEDILVGKEYWNFLGGKDTFEQLLDVFDKVGKKYKQTLIQKFKETAKNKN